MIRVSGTHTFRMAKSNLRARPIFHRERDAIEAHLTVVFAALAVSLHLQGRHWASIKKLVHTLRPLRTVHIDIGRHPITAAPQITAEARALLDRLPAFTAPGHSERVRDGSACLRDPVAAAAHGGPMARRKTARKGYPSDLTDAQWELVEPLLPAPKTGGRPEKHPRRLIVDAILYVVRTGCSWRQLPTDFPPWETVYWYFTRWEDAKVTEKILAAVREQLRVTEGREPEPSAGAGRLPDGEGR